MEIMTLLAAKAEKNLRTIVFPEGEDPVVLQAVQRLKEKGVVRPVLLGNSDAIQRRLAETPGAGRVEVLDPADPDRLERYVERYCRERDMPPSVGRRVVADPLCFAGMMVKAGDAHGMVAGIAHTTGEVILASELSLGLQPGITLVSSFFLMEIPHFRGGEGGRVLFADPSVNPDPGPEELADIAVSTALSARDLFGWEPRVAMLSFSTRGSADHPRVDKVIRATSLAREKAPDILIEGELQADTALVEAVARKKVGSESSVAGRANILIFPDLDAANIASKLVQHLARAASYGPVLQGFSRPVSDLSRGATVEDVIGAALMVAARS